jgi:hypothetical protein
MQAQHHSKMVVEFQVLKQYVHSKKYILINQNDTLTSIVLNDWNNAYSNKNTPAKRFSDEFYRGFIWQEEERVSTTISLFWIQIKWIYLGKEPRKTRFNEIKLKEKLLPNQKITLFLSYLTKIPSDKFTKYGYSSNGLLL